MAFPSVNAGDIIRAANIMKFTNVLGGTAGEAEPVLLTQLGTTDYTLSLRNLATGATGARALRVQTAGSADAVLMKNVALSPSGDAAFTSWFGDRVTIGTNTHRDANLLLVHKSITSGPWISLVGIEFNNDAPSGATDTGALTVVHRAQTAGTNAIRAGEFQTIKYAATGHASTLGLEVGMHTSKTSTSFADVGSGSAQTQYGQVGALIYCTTSVDGASIGVRGNTGIVLGGDAGWKQGIVYFDTNAITKLFEVDQNGRMLLRNVILAGASADNTPSAPVYSFELDGDTGMYRVGTNQIGWATNGVQQMTLSTSMLTVNQGLTLAKNQVYTGIISPAQITSNQNDYNPTNLGTTRILQIQSDAARDITGLTAQATGTMITVANVGGFTITLKHESASSVATNRFALPGGADLALTLYSTAMLYYDGTRWRLAA